MLKLSFTVLLLVIILCGSDAKDYCNSSYDCAKQKHVSCLYKPDVLSDNCTEALSYGLSEGEKQKILDYHNLIRLIAADSVSRFLKLKGRNPDKPDQTKSNKLVWDDELAEIAQTWANQCHPGGKSCSVVDRFKEVSTISGIIDSTNSSGFQELTVKNLVKQLYLSVRKKVNDTKIPPLIQQEMNRNFYILVSKTVTSIGCGTVKYKPESNKYRFYMVCNYGPTDTIPKKDMSVTSRIWAALLGQIVFSEVFNLVKKGIKKIG